MEKMVVKERIGFFMVDVNSFCYSCIPYPTQVLKRIHYYLPVVAGKANNLLLIIIKVCCRHLSCSIIVCDGKL